MKKYKILLDLADYQPQLSERHKLKIIKIYETDSDPVKINSYIYYRMR
jgi:hypothetical protein